MKNTGKREEKITSARPTQKWIRCRFEFRLRMCTAGPVPCQSTPERPAAAGARLFKGRDGHAGLRKGPARLSRPRFHALSRPERRSAAPVRACVYFIIYLHIRPFSAPQTAPCALACGQCGLDSAPGCATRSPSTSLTSLWIEKQVRWPVFFETSTHAVGVPDWPLQSPDGRSPRQAKAVRGPRPGLRGGLDPALSRPDPNCAVLAHSGT